MSGINEKMTVRELKQFFAEKVSFKVEHFKLIF